MGELNSAIEHFKRTLTIKHDSIDAYIKLGEAFEESGDTIHASECYEKAKELNPDWKSALK